ncbi:MAG: TldD/PmbA family protein [Gemmatimonadota bacterium]
MMERRDFVKSTAIAAGGLAIAPGLVRGAASGDLAPPPPVDPAIRDLLLEALDAARSAGAAYADARVELVRRQSVSTRERQITGVSESSTRGVGVRAFVDGSWGFAATQTLEREAVARVGRGAASIARANAKVQKAAIRLAPVEGYGDVSWTSALEIDPWDVPLEDKVELFLSLNDAALGAEAVRFVSSGLQAVKIDKTLATTEGTVAAQRIVRVSPFMNITAVSADRTDFQSRGSVVEPAGRGWEYVRANMTPSNVERWAAEASEKLGAASVEPGAWDLVVHPANLWLTIHESIGHPTELDRALGYEANYAGTSFLAPPEAVIGKLRYGPDFMTVEAERTSAGGLASVGWDDEGVPAERWLLIRDGVFVDYQTTREQVDWIRDLTGIDHSHGCSFADSWSSIPFQRMPNINLLPGDEDLTEEDVIGSTDRGIYVEGRGSYSIDQQRYNFQFGGQVFWEIRGGRKVRMLRDVAYQARTTDFWNSLTLLGGPSTYFVGGTFNDGKGQPGQVNAVSHGCPIAMFRGVNILNTGRSG